MLNKNSACISRAFDDCDPFIWFFWFSYLSADSALQGPLERTCPTSLLRSGSNHVEPTLRSLHLVLPYKLTGSSARLGCYSFPFLNCSAYRDFAPRITSAVKPLNITKLQFVATLLPDLGKLVRTFLSHYGSSHVMKVLIGFKPNVNSPEITASLRLTETEFPLESRSLG